MEKGSKINFEELGKAYNDVTLNGPGPSYVIVPASYFDWCLIEQVDALIEDLDPDA